VPEGLEILGVDNGCQTSMERFKDNKRSAFFGKCLVVLKGAGMLKARAMGMEDSSLKVE
jgi:beta-galactosidase